MYRIATYIPQAERDRLLGYEFPSPYDPRGRLIRRDDGTMSCPLGIILGGVRGVPTCSAIAEELEDRNWVPADVPHAQLLREVRRFIRAFDTDRFLSNAAIRRALGVTPS